MYINNLLINREHMYINNLLINREHMYIKGWYSFHLIKSV